MRQVNVLQFDMQNAKRHFHREFDLFVCSSSFEDRCRSIADSVTTGSVGGALIFQNSDYEDYVAENTKYLVSKFGERANVVRGSTTNALRTADELRRALIDARASGVGGMRILVDITTFTHESLLILLRLLRRHCDSDVLECAYTNAREYSVGDNVSYKWLSRGVGEVRTVLGYPGNVKPSKKTHLIVVVGYEHERAAQLIERIEPHSISLGYGRSGSATTEKDKNANQHYSGLVEAMAAQFDEVAKFEVLCDSPAATCAAISEQIKLGTDKGLNVILAPMNNKLTTVGAAIAAFNDDSVQICYAQALRYNYSSYSLPGTSCYTFDLSSVLSASLEDAGT